MQPDDSRPTYVQVADTLRGEIRRGSLRPGDRLPSVRDLATRFDIAAVTVQSALRILRDEGYITSRSTRGYFVRDALPTPSADEPSTEFTALRDQLDDIRDLVRELAGRVNRLESAADSQAEATPHRSPPPPTGADG